MAQSKKLWSDMEDEDSDDEPKIDLKPITLFHKDSSREITVCNKTEKKICLNLIYPDRNTTLKVYANSERTVYDFGRNFKIGLKDILPDIEYTLHLNDEGVVVDDDNDIESYEKNKVTIAYSSKSGFGNSIKLNNGYNFDVQLKFIIAAKIRYIRVNAQTYRIYKCPDAIVSFDGHVLKDSDKAIYNLKEGLIEKVVTEFSDTTLPTTSSSTRHGIESSRHEQPNSTIDPIDGKLAEIMLLAEVEGLAFTYILKDQKSSQIIKTNIKTS